MECKHVAIALRCRQYGVCRSPGRACEKCGSEQQCSLSRARLHCLPFAAAVFQAAAYLPAHGLGVLSSLTSLQHLPQAATAARFNTKRFAWLPTLLRGGGMQIPTLRPAEGCGLGSGKVIDFAFLSERGVEKSLLEMTGWQVSSLKYFISAKIL